jgi:hypothetical protein
MKKSILLLGGAGIAAGVAIALTTTKKKKEPLTDGEKEEQLTSHGEDSNESSSLEAPQSSTDDDQKSSMKKLGAESESPAAGEIEIDHHGTDQETASAILGRVRDGAFEASDEKLALALGRPTEEVTGWMNGSEIIDGDVLLKARALAMERGVEVPDAAASH